MLFLHLLAAHFKLWSSKNLSIFKYFRKISSVKCPKLVYVISAPEHYECNHFSSCFPCFEIQINLWNWNPSQIRKGNPHPNPCIRPTSKSVNSNPQIQNKIQIRESVHPLGKINLHPKSIGWSASEFVLSCEFLNFLNPNLTPYFSFRVETQNFCNSVCHWYVLLSFDIVVSCYFPRRAV